MKRPVFFITIFLAFLLSSGCGNMRIKDTRDPNASLVYGYVDMGNAPVNLAWLQFKQIRPITKKRFRSFWIKDNSLFYHYNIPDKSSFSIYEFGTTDPVNGTVVNTMPMYGDNARTFKVREPGSLVFLGSFRYRGTIANIGNIFRKAGFGLVPSRKPAEKEVLLKLLPHTKGSKWEARVNKRIKELGGQ
jgi:hypothetical protein